MTWACVKFLIQVFTSAGAAVNFRKIWTAQSRPCDCKYIALKIRQHRLKLRIFRVYASLLQTDWHNFSFICFWWIIMTSKTRSFSRKRLSPVTFGRTGGNPSRNTLLNMRSVFFPLVISSVDRDVSAALNLCQWNSYSDFAHKAKTLSWQSSLNLII